MGIAHLFTGDGGRCPPYGTLGWPWCRRIDRNSTDLDNRLRKAVAYFWATRDAQARPRKIQTHRPRMGTFARDRRERRGRDKIFRMAVAAHGAFPNCAKSCMSCSVHSLSAGSAFSAVNNPGFDCPRESGLAQAAPTTARSANVRPIANRSLLSLPLEFPAVKPIHARLA